MIKYRVFRGGSWDSDPWHARAANRYRSSVGYRDYFYGFRLIKRRKK